MCEIYGALWEIGYNTNLSSCDITPDDATNMHIYVDAYTTAEKGYTLTVTATVYKDNSFFGYFSIDKYITGGMDALDIPVALSGAGTYTIRYIEIAYKGGGTVCVRVI